MSARGCGTLGQRTAWVSTAGSGVAAFVGFELQRSLVGCWSLTLECEKAPDVLTRAEKNIRFNKEEKRSLN